MQIITSVSFYIIFTAQSLFYLELTPIRLGKNVALRATAGKIGGQWGVLGAEAEGPSAGVQTMGDGSSGAMAKFSMGRVEVKGPLGAR